MFIGGLNWDTTDGRSLVFLNSGCVVLNSVHVEGLKKYFEQFGRVEACTIMRDATGRSRCFAFLTFEEPASVNAVMVREHYLDGKIASGCSTVVLPVSPPKFLHGGAKDIGFYL